MKRRILTIFLGAAICVPAAHAKPQPAASADEKVSAAALPIEVGAGDAIIHSVRQPLLNAPPS